MTAKHVTGWFNSFPHVVIIISVFGPYIFPSAGVRTEHLSIYLMFLFYSLAFLAARRAIRLNSLSLIISVCFFAVAVWTLLISVTSSSFVYSHKIISGMENFIQPGCIILICEYLKNVEKVEHLIERCIFAFLVLLSFNALLQITSVFTDISFVTNAFTTGDQFDETHRKSVSAAAASMGRYSGIFNQPIEAGLTYSLGLFTIYLLTVRSKIKRLTQTIFLILICVGGFLCVSKVFIFVGFPIFLILVFSSRHIVRFITVPSFVATTSIIIIINEYLYIWKGSNMLLSKFTGDNQDIVSTFTAGRWGKETGTIDQLYYQVLSEAPFRGLGYNIQAALDNAYIEFYAQGGAIALIFYIIILLTMLLMINRSYFLGNKSTKIMFVMWLLTIIGGMGAPVLTINRFSTLFWVFFMLLYDEKQDFGPPKAMLDYNSAE